MLFASGTAPDFKMVPIGNEFPDRPSEKHKHGVRLMIKLAKDCGGDKPIREIAGTSKAFLSGIEAVYTAVSGGEGQASRQVAGHRPGKDDARQVRNWRTVFDQLSPDVQDRRMGAAWRSGRRGLHRRLTAARLLPARRRSKRRRLPKRSAPTTSASAVGSGRLQPTWPLHRHARPLREPAASQVRFGLSEKTRLEKLLGMLGSSFDGERANAARMISAMAEKQKLTVVELIYGANDAAASGTPAAEAKARPAEGRSPRQGGDAGHHAQGAG